MRCRDVKDLLAAYAEDALASPRSEAIRAHLDACEPCRRETAALHRALDALCAASHVPSPDLWGGFQARLARATPGVGCAEVQPLLPAHAAGEVERQEHLAINAHLTDCPRCAAEEGRLTRALGALERASRAAPAIDLWPRLAERLAREPARQPVRRRFSLAPGLAGFLRAPLLQPAFGLAAVVALALVARSAWQPGAPSSPSNGARVASSALPAEAVPPSGVREANGAGEEHPSQVAAVPGPGGNLEAGVGQRKPTVLHGSIRPRRVTRGMAPSRPRRSVAKARRRWTRPASAVVATRRGGARKDTGTSGVPRIASPTDGLVQVARNDPPRFPEGGSLPAGNAPSPDINSVQAHDRVTPEVVQVVALLAEMDAAADPFNSHTNAQ